MSDYNTFWAGLPNQLVPLSEKIGNGEGATNWGKRCMDFFDAVGAFQTEEKRKDYKNYQLFNGQYEPADYEYAIDPFLLDDQPEGMAKFRHYPICSPPIKELWGEIKNRPFNFMCKGESDEQANVFMESKADMLKQFVQSQVMGILQQEGKLQIDPQTQQPMTPPQIEKYMKRSYQSEIERFANLTLKYELKARELKKKCDNGAFNGLIAGKEFYLSTIINEEPYFNTLNPLVVFYDKSLSMKYIDEGDYAGTRDYMSPSQVINTYGSQMSEDEVKSLMVNYSVSGMRQVSQIGAYGAINSQSPLYSTDVVSFQDLFHDSQNQFNYFNNQLGLLQNGTTLHAGRIPVTTAYWRSKRKIGFLTWEDENGMEQEDVVDESYKPVKSKGEHVEWQWVNELWEGVKIGTDIYIGIRPCPYQFKTLDRIHDIKLPITGIIYNCLNSRPTSILDEMKPYQELYNIMMYKLEKDMNTEMGRVLLMNYSAIPKREGWDEKKWLWYLREMKIAWADTSKENFPEGSNFAHYQSIDASLGDSIQYKIEQLEYLRKQCNYIAGTTDARLGSTSNSETVGGIERSVAQSVNQTEMYFSTHQDVVQRALSIHLNTCQLAYKDGKILNFIGDDMATNFGKIEAGVFPYERMGVFMSDSTEDWRILNALRSMAQPALQNGADLLDVAELETTNSIAEMRDKLEEIKEERIQREQQANALKQQELQQQQAQWEQQRQDVIVDKQLDRQNKIDIEQLKIFGDAALGAKNADVNQNGIPDALEMAKLAHENSKTYFENMFKQREISQRDKEASHKQRIEEKKIDLKAKEIALKDKHHIQSMKMEEKKMKSDEKIARTNKIARVSQNKKKK